MVQVDFKQKYHIHHSILFWYWTVYFISARISIILNDRISSHWPLTESKSVHIQEAAVFSVITWLISFSWITSQTEIYNLIYTLWYIDYRVGMIQWCTVASWYFFWRSTDRYIHLDIDTAFFPQSHLNKAKST